VAQTDGTKRMVRGATLRFGEASNRPSELTGYGRFLACVGIEMPYEPLAVDRSELAVNVSAPTVFSPGLAVSGHPELPQST